MLTLSDEEDLRSHEWLGWLQALLLGLLISGTALVLGGMRPWVLLPAYGVVGLLLLSQIGRLLITRHSAIFRFDLIDFSVTAFLIYAVIRYLSGPVEYYARWELLNVMSYATAFWIARYALTHHRQGIFLLFTIALLAIGIALFSLWLKTNPGFTPWGESLQVQYAPRLTGPFGCPNHLGAFLIMGLAAGLGLALFLRGWWPLRFFLFGGVVLCLIVVVLSLAGGSWLGLVGALLAITFFCVRHSSLTWVFPVSFFLFSVVVGIIVLLQAEGATQRLQEITHHVQEGTLRNYGRVQLAEDALKIWTSYPLFGSGPATFAFMHPRVQGADYQTLALYTHNDYLNLLSDYGLVGAIFAGGFLMAATWGLARKIDHRAPANQRILLCAAGAAWAALLVNSLIDFNLHVPAIALTLFTVVGLGLRRQDILGAQLPWQHRHVINFGLSLFFTLGLCGFAYLAGKTAQGYYPYWQATEFSAHLRPQDEASSLAPASALPLLRQATLADPHAPEAFRVQGHLEFKTAQAMTDFRQQRQWAETALETYQKGLQANPLDDGFSLQIALAYDLLQRYEESFALYRTLIKQQPYNGYFRAALGNHFLARKRYLQALEAFSEAQLCPYAPPALELTIAQIEARLTVPNSFSDEAITLP
jgi:O-antigen ligase